MNAADKTRLTEFTMSEAIWIATTLRLPVDGQQVLVKTRYGVLEHRVTFRAAPWSRWETPHLISDVNLYAFWRPLHSEQRCATSEAHASQ